MAININDLINKVDSTLHTEIAEAKKAFQKTVKDTNEIATYPSSMFGQGEYTRQELAEEFMLEAHKVRVSSSATMVSALDEVLAVMEELKKDTKNLRKIAILTQRLRDWIGLFDELTIPASKYTKKDPYIIHPNIVKAVKQWTDYCTYDPIMKKADLYEQKGEFEDKLVDLDKRIIECETVFTSKKDELNYRTLHGQCFEDEVRQQIELEIDDLNTDIRRANQKVSTDMVHLCELQQKKAMAGILAFRKGKELKEQIKSATVLLENDKANIVTLENKKKEIQDGLSVRIDNLQKVIVMLSEEVGNKAEELAKLKQEREDTNNRLEFVEKQIKS